MWHKRIKVIIAIVLVALILPNMKNVQAASNFADVPETFGAYQEIQYLVDQGIIHGYQENGRSIFKPVNTVTRGQAAKMLVIASGEKPLYVDEASFSDVPVGTELSTYVERAVELGYFPPTSNGQFLPNQPLNRGDMSYILTKAFKLDNKEFEGFGTAFSDVSESHKYASYVNAIYYAGITDGSNGKFMIDGNVLRSQFASFVARAINEKFTLELPVKGITTQPNPDDVIGYVQSSVDGLEIRTTTTGMQNNLIGYVNQGGNLGVYAVEGSWLKVTYKGRFAYVLKQNTTFIDKDSRQPLGGATKEVKAKMDLNLYFDATSSAKKIGYIKEGTKLPVYKNVKGYYLTTVDGLPGYIVADSTEDVTPVAPEPSPDPEPGEVLPPPTTGDTNTRARVTYDFVNVRSAANNNSSQLGTLSKGQYAQVAGTTGDWVNIMYNGRSGYVHKAYVKLINQNGNPLQKRVIVIDAGHGGKDPGTVYGSYSEKAITLAVAKKVQQKLKAAGADVRMTREVDKFLPLQTIVDISHANNAEAFISIHVNSASSNAYGTETYYYTSGAYTDTPNEERYLAKLINDQIVKDANMYNRGVKSGNFQVIRNTDRVALLVELGFLTNANDRAKMTNDKYQDIYAEAIVKGLRNYYAN